MEVIQFAVVLHLDDEQAATAVLHQHIGPVEFVGGVRLVGFAFQEAFDAQVFSQQGREEAFQYHVVTFVPQQPFHGPIEAYQVVFHISSLFIGGIKRCRARCPAFLLQSYGFSRKRQVSGC